MFSFNAKFVKLMYLNLYSDGFITHTEYKIQDDHLVSKFRFHGTAVLTDTNSLTSNCPVSYEVLKGADKDNMSISQAKVWMEVEVYMKIGDEKLVESFGLSL